MNNEPVPTDADKLLEIAQNIASIPSIQSERIRAEKEKLAGYIRGYFSDRLKRNGGVITTDILQIADKLYIGGMTTILADSLHISAAELRIKLGRKKQVNCEACGSAFEVIEPRRIGGYTPTNDKRCSSCQKKQYAEWRAADEQTQYEQERDARLLSRIAISRNPMEFEEFRLKLRHYAQHWLIEGYEQMSWSFGFRAGGGCMMCGATPIRVYLDLKTPLDEYTQKNWQRIVEAHYHNYPDSNPYPPIVRAVQGLYQFRPQDYFMSYPHFPLLEMPLLLFCKKCSKFVSRTHEDVLDEEFDTE